MPFPTVSFHVTFSIHRTHTASNLTCIHRYVIRYVVLKLKNCIYYMVMEYLKQIITDGLAYGGAVT